MRNIFLDDLRIPLDVKWIKLPELPEKETWFIVRSFEQFCSHVAFLSVYRDQPIERVCFDHDLAEEHYPGSEDYSKGNTGYDCALYLAQVIIDNDWPVPEYVVHSLNPAAKGRIDAAMGDVERYRQRIK